MHLLETMAYGKANRSGIIRPFQKREIPFLISCSDATVLTPYTGIILILILNKKKVFFLCCRFRGISFYYYHFGKSGNSKFETDGQFMAMLLYSCMNVIFELLVGKKSSQRTNFLASSVHYVENWNDTPYKLLYIEPKQDTKKNMAVIKGNFIQLRSFVGLFWQHKRSNHRSKNKIFWMIPMYKQKSFIR